MRTIHAHRLIAVILAGALTSFSAGSPAEAITVINPCVSLNILFPPDRAAISALSAKQQKSLADFAQCAEVHDPQYGLEIATLSRKGGGDAVAIARAEAVSSYFISKGARAYFKIISWPSSSQLPDGTISIFMYPPLPSHEELLRQWREP